MKLKNKTTGKSKKAKKEMVYEVKVGLRSKENKSAKIRKIERSESCF